MINKFFVFFLLLMTLTLKTYSSDSFNLNILSIDEEKLFNKGQYKKLLISLNENIQNNDARNFYTGYLLYKRGLYNDAVLFFESVKDKNLKAFANYYMGRYSFNHNKIKKAEEIFKETNENHYFKNALLLHLAKIYLHKNNLKKFEEVYEKLILTTKKKQKKEIQKMYIKILYKNRKGNTQPKSAKHLADLPLHFSALQKEGNKKKLKKEIFRFLDFDSLANNPWLKFYVKKFIKTEEDYLNLLLKRYYYLINKFKYGNALSTIDSEISRYGRYRSKAKGRKRKNKLLGYQNRLYLLKAEILYKLRRYRKTKPIFDRLLKYKNAQYFYWYFKVLKKTGRLKMYEAYYKKYYKIFKNTEYIEEIDYLRAILNFNNHKAKAEKLFLEFFKKYKLSSKILEMEEKLAWFYYRKGKYSKAIFLYKKMSECTIDKKRDLGLYWLGKIYKKIGLNEEGEKYWSKILINSPLTYYSNLVLNYSSNNFQKTTLSKRNNLNRALKVKNFDNIIKDKEIPSYIRFFIKYKLYNLAKYELFYLYKSKNRNIKHNLKLALSKLFYLNEKTVKYAHAIFHRGMSGADYPENDSLEIWRLAFPNMFKNDVKFAARKTKVSKNLIYSIMREESSFNRLAKSYSNAYGLMQLIYPTARRIRWKLKGYTGLNFNSSWKLFNSRYNVSLGATYLRMLNDQFKGNKISMIASYNAGENRIARWRKKYKHLSEDEFVESIPINQTKDYVKKVLRSYYIYSYIYDDKSKLNYVPLFK